MSGRHSALASLTANYTDSEDEDLSPLVIDAPSGLSEDGGSSEDGQKPKSVESTGSLTLVSYHSVDESITRVASQERVHVEAMESLAIFSSEPSPLQDSVSQGTLENVSSEDDLTSSPKVKLPPEPEGKCSKELQDKFQKMLEGKIKGKLNMNEKIQTNKTFRNPSIYEKLISYLDIDEFGTNYPDNMFNPHEWTEASFYDELAKTQKAEMDRLEKERKERTKVDFVSGTAKRTVVAVPPLPISSATTGGGGPSDGEVRRKSKWDQRGVMPPLLMTVGAQPPASSISSINAPLKSKSVTISAFGSLPKKK